MGLCNAVILVSKAFGYYYYKSTWGTSGGDVEEEVREEEDDNKECFPLDWVWGLCWTTTLGVSFNKGSLEKISLGFGSTNPEGDSHLPASKYIEKCQGERGK